MLQTGARLGPYQVVSPLGAGGMGEVYRAHDTRLGRDVAVKVLPKELTSDSQRLLRFEQEARAAGSISHPNILAIHDVGSQNGLPYLVAELLRGREPPVAGDDHAITAREDRVGEAELADRGRDLCDLLLAMGAGVARVRNKITGLAISDLQPGAFRQGLGQSPGLDVRHDRAFRICAAGSP